MNFKGKGRRNNGITLIALVITIIVLLILAGVTIMMLMGSENAPQKASEAVEKDAIAGAKNEVAMEAQSAILDYYNKKYVEGNETEEKRIQEVVSEAASTAVGNAKTRNNQLLNSSGVNEDYTITLETKSYTVTGTIEENGSITWGDIVASTGGGLDKEIDKTAELKIGDYVEYGVTYKDVYSYYDFTKSTGWRVLDKGTDNGDGTFSNVKLISTGVPARLDCFADESILNNYINDGNSDEKWVGNEEDVEEYLDFSNDTGERGSLGIKMAAGLYKNFNKTTYTHGKEPQKDSIGNEIGKGSYQEINGKTNIQLTGNEFILSEKAEEVHNLTLYELNNVLGLDGEKWFEEYGYEYKNEIIDADTLKLFWLQDQYRDLGYYENAGDTYGNYGDEWFDYWLSCGHYYLSACLSRSANCFGSYGNSRAGKTRGVRPVVTLSSPVYKTGEKWVIK